MNRLAEHEREYLTSRCYRATHTRTMRINSIKDTGLWGQTFDIHNDFKRQQTQKNNREIRRHEYKIGGIKRLREAVQAELPISDLLRDIEDYVL